MIYNDICATVVLYKPTSEDIDNIYTYSSVVERIYIIDNSDYSNEALFKSNSKITYIANYKNLGIARALNIGASLAFKDGFKFCLTMDQDSVWNTEILANFINSVHKRYKNNIAIYSPKIIRSDDNSYVLLKLFNSFHNSTNIDYLFVDKAITSGSIINLDIWKNVDGFLDKLFIDEVDFEYCYRVAQYGYKILLFNNFEMKQTFGKVRKSFFPLTYSYRRERIYYIFRNKLYIIKNFKKMALNNHYILFLICVILGKTLTFNFIDISYAIKGIRDFLKCKFGKLNK